MVSMVDGINTMHGADDMADDFPLATLAAMATPQELRSLYLAISKRVHPDRSGGSNEAMQKLNAAWDAVKNGDPDGNDVRGLTAIRRARIESWRKTMRRSQISLTAGTNGWQI